MSHDKCKNDYPNNDVGDAKEREIAPHNNLEAVKCVLAGVHIEYDWTTGFDSS